MTALGFLTCPEAVRGIEQPETKGAIESPLVETTGVSLILLDVVVTDESGRPIPGLAKEDFRLQLNWRQREIYSVDELCPCTPRTESAGPAGPAATEGTTTGGDVAAAKGEATEGVIEREPGKFVLYFDFSQLQMDGRSNALAEARRWIDEDMGPDDRSMLVAYASQPGLRELTPFTGDRESLLSTLGSVETDPLWLDTFPAQFWDRVEQCRICCESPCPQPCPACCPDCPVNAKDEYQHGRRSLKALKRLLGRLEGVPGRKVMLFFNQNGILFPARFYPVDEFTVGDHLGILDEVGAEATTARTALYVAYSGNQPNLFDGLASQAVSFGANLADFTGGAYNRTAGLLPDLTRSATECACIYRIAIESPETDRAKVYRAVVEVLDRRIPYRYRVQYLTEMDRWWRRATDVLIDPDRADEVPLAAAIVPLGCTKERWSVALQVVLKPHSLLLLPGKGGAAGGWEVGALLQREEKSVGEMLGVSEIRRAGKGEVPAGAVIVHERRFDDLASGQYRLGAFVRDRNAGSFGGAEAEIHLPKPGGLGIAGPILMVRDSAWLRSDLPMWKKGKAKASARTAEVETGAVSRAPEPVAAGVTLEAHTWVCSPADGTAAAAMRYVSMSETPLFRFEIEQRRGDGACVEIVDQVETRGLASGSYAYHVRWRGETRSAPFEVSGAALAGEAGP